jgi:diaminohydroxyphosphoribosylaminopyrimidine deaminase/5-amino-6-(5-phosphoribosylamino)uracil reductase
MNEDERFMNLALELARRPLATYGNPRVGALVVRDGAVLAEGFHRGAGSAHAEADALTGVDAEGATMYVTLEPCSHQGRTPACAPLLVEAGLGRVVVALEDPDPRVAGAGIAALESAGIDVTVGVMAGSAERLNAAYLHHRRTGRAYLTLKLALSQDGRMGAPDGSSRWITGEAARLQVHRRRAEAGAVMVGSGTVLADDPSLTAREVGAVHQPLKVVLDGSGRVSPDRRILDTGETLIVTTDRCPHETVVAWKEAGAEVSLVQGDDGAVDIRALLEMLGRRGIVEVYAEGGAELATSLLAGDHVDKLEVYRGPVVLGAGGPEIGPLGLSRMADARTWHLESAGSLGPDTFQILTKEAPCSRG